MSEQVRAALAAIVDGRTLTVDEAREAMGAVMDGEATPSQLAALLMGLRMRGETVDELTGFALAMRERVVPVEAPAGTIDVVGTGGDASGTFNISTTAALVVAAAGHPRGQARQPRDHVEVGLGGRPRRAGGSHRPRRGLGGHRDPRARVRVPVRAVVPPGDAPRGADPPRDRRADGVQPGRATDEPGRARPAP